MRREHDANRARWARMTAQELWEEVLRTEGGIRGVFEMRKEGQEGSLLYRMYEARRFDEEEAKSEKEAAELRAKWERMTLEELERNKPPHSGPRFQLHIYEELLAAKKESVRLAQEQARKRRFPLAEIVVAVWVAVLASIDGVNRIRAGTFGNGIESFIGLGFAALAVAGVAFALVRWNSRRRR